MITPFLMLVLAGFGVFIVVLGTVWARNYADDLRAQRATAEQAKPSQGDVRRSAGDRLAA